MARHLTVIMVLAWILPAVAAVDPPSQPPTPAPVLVGPPVPLPDHATPIFLESPASLDAFLAKIQSPDFVLLRGDRYQALLKATSPAAVSPKPTQLSSPITRVTIGGTAGSKTAELVVEFELSNDDAAPRWVPLRLDGLPIGRVSESGRLLPARSVAAGAWEVEIAGSGKHVVEVAFTAGVTTNGEERRLDVAIPLAATTALNLTLNETPIDATLGGHDPIIPQKIAGRAGGKLAVAMTPRNRLDLTWRVPLDQSMVLPPLLSAQGELAVDITADAIRTRARWTITAVRGTTRFLEFTLDPEEDLIDLELDGRPLAIDTTTQGTNRLLVIDLPDPLRQGSLANNVTFTTRRKLPTRNASRVRLKGYALAGATLQTGAISLTQNGAIWVEGTAGRGLTRIDPADDLPSELRSRPGTILAYRFVEQPFDLTIKVDPTQPSLENRVKSLITVAPELITNESEFHFRATPGQVFSLQFRVPSSVTLDNLPTDENIESVKLSLEATSDRPEIVHLAKRVLNIRLTAHARDLGVFTIKLVTHQRWEKTSQTMLGLIEPVAATSLGGRVAIRRAVGVDVALNDASVKPSESVFLTALPPAPGDWTIPTTPQSGLEPNLKWLTYEGTPDTLPLRLTRRPQSVRTDTEIRAKVLRDGVEYRSQSVIEVVNGLLSEVEIIVPPNVDRLWDIEGTEIARRELAETLANGSRRYNLTLAKSEAKRLDLRLRYRVTFDRSIPIDANFSSRFERVRLLPRGEGTTRFSFESDPGIRVTINETGWTQRLATSSTNSTDVSQDISSETNAYVSTNSDSLPEFAARAEPLVAMPSLVISRALITTLAGADELRTNATLRLEAHGRDVVFGLPADARWIQAQVNGQPVSELEKVDNSGQYRIALPAGPNLILSVDYATPSRSISAWAPPTVEEAVWQTTYWNVTVPNTYAVLGVPAGWTDQNEWYWDRFVWMRKPVLAAEDLRAWLSGTSRKRGLDEFAFSGAGHSYLFRRTDGPAPLPLTTVTRVLLLAICSGSVGLFGILLVIARPALRSLIIPFAMGVFIISIGWDPNITLQVVQSGTLGAAMAVIAALLQRLVDRRGGNRPPRVIEASPSHTQAPQRTTSLVNPPDSGDESTAIRPRPPLSNDRIVIAPPINPSIEPPPRPQSSVAPSVESGLEP